MVAAILRSTHPMTWDQSQEKNMRLTSSFVSVVLFASLGSSLQAQTSSIEPAKPVRPTTQTGKLNAITDVPGI